MAVTITDEIIPEPLVYSARQSSHYEAFTLAAIVFAFSLVPRIVFIRMPPATLVRVIPDDAFYYLTIAKSIAAGHGSTFDAIHPTNGYHPLWMGLLTLVAALHPNGWLFVRTDLVLSLFCGTLSCLLLFMLISGMTENRLLPAIGVGLYALNSQSMLNSLDGLETGLCTFGLLVCVWLYVRGDWREGNLRAPAVLGLAIGLAVLARTDDGVYAVMFMCLVGTHLIRAAQWRQFATILGTAAATVAPWFLWNWWQFREIIQSSGLAVPYAERERFILGGHDTHAVYVHSAAYLIHFVRDQFPQDIGYSGMGCFLLMLLAGGLAWYRRGAACGSSAADQRRAAMREVLLALMLGSALLVFVHTFLRWYPRDYYFDPVIALSSLLACATAIPLVNRRFHILGGPAWRGLQAALVGLAFYEAILGANRIADGAYPWQVSMLNAGTWLRRHTPPDARAASFNAGIIGFESHRHVINLDGVADNAAFAAIQHRSVIQFMENSGTAYYVDWQPVMTTLYRPFMGSQTHAWRVTPLVRFGRPGMLFQNSYLIVALTRWHTSGSSLPKSG